MITDPDKKVAKAQKKRPGVYQSKQHPEHFENEGGEYAEKHSEMRPGEQDFSKGNDKIKSKRDDIEGEK